MASDAEPSSRNQDRHNHIGIRLQYRAHGKWEHLQALHWSPLGFSFYYPQAIEHSVLELKRGLTHFEGRRVWSAVGSDDATVLEALINELVFKRAREVVQDPVRQARLLKLIRVSGMVAEKRQVLASLGLDIPDDRLERLIATRKRERPLIQYGVRVDSPLWAGVVADALSLSSALVSLEQWSRSLHAPLSPGD